MGWRARFGVLVAEPCCFACKDGGENLIVCTYNNCLKSYHPSCTVRKEGDDFPASNPFICIWHACVYCKKSPDYYCLCCPNSSVCHNCLGKITFFKLGKQNKGLCVLCFDLAMLIEKNAAYPQAKRNDLDSDVGFILFKDYWNKVKDEERLTLLDLQVASVSRHTGPNHTRKADSNKFPDEDLLGNFDNNEQTFPPGFKKNPDKMNASVKIKSSEKKSYVDWGTKELIEFLSYFGKGTKEPLDEIEVVGLVKEYIKQKGLFLGDKKKYFECDDKLRPLFTRRKVRYNMLHSKLRMLLAGNAASEDESLDTSEDDDDSIMKKKQKTSLEPKIAKRVSQRNKKCLASLNQHNIELIYLRRKLVANLLKDEDTFEQKVVGCFVRVMHNARSYFHQKSRRSFQLGLVTGIKESQEVYKIKDTNTTTKVLLCVAGFGGCVKISMLSEENIEEEECNELISLAEKGILPRATVAEFEEKVAAVHTVLVNHWIDRELNRLEKQIDMAHEKGWRQEMFEQMDRKKLLTTPAERQRRLEEVPEIIVDVEEEKQTKLTISTGNSCQVNRGKNKDNTACLVDMEENSKDATPPVADSFHVLKEKPPKGVAEYASESLEVMNEKPPEGAAKKMVRSYSLNLNKVLSKVASKQGDATHGAAFEAAEAFSSGVTPDPVMHSQVYMAQDGSKTQVIDIDKDERNYTKNNSPVHEVINLDSSDDEEP